MFDWYLGCSFDVDVGKYVKKMFPMKHAGWLLSYPGYSDEVFF